MRNLAENIEIIEKDGVELCYIVRAGFEPETTTFITQPEYKQQVGFIKYEAGGVIARHTHVPLERRLVGTSEVVVVRRGSCQLEVYTEDRELVATRDVGPGDLILMVSGGHGFNIYEDTVLLEVKQGPYTGLEEKERF
ncbi:MAG TPA: hypothetical protein VJ801_16680 [Polyangia bacterium]|jgi:hypothetical protein|nr:hypothetical protein [Polyangia bacterium]